MTRHLLEYVASSVMLHVSDAWALLGRGVNAHVYGHTPIGLHLLYYSELRSVQSLLARQGIVLFNKNNFVVDSKSRTAPLNGLLSNPGTHGATWDVYSAWADIFAARYLGENLRVAGSTLDEWAAARPAPADLSSVAPDLLKKWGIDLKLAVHDHDLRNVASYEPTRLVPHSDFVSPARAQSVMQDIWRLLEPSRPNQFELFDRFLLRQTLEQFFRSATGRLPKGKEFVAEVGVTIDRLAPAFGADLLPQFLTRQISADPGPLTAAASGSRPLSGSNASFDAVCGRALLLARLATGGAHDLIDSSGVGTDALHFWADDIARVHGFPPDVPGEFLDSWDEVSNAISDTQEMSNFGSVDDVLRTRQWGRDIATMVGLERVSTWSVSA